MGRFQLFSQTLHQLKTIKRKYQAGITQFSDMIEQEFLKTYGNLDISALVLSNSNPSKFVPKGTSPDSYNYIDHGYLQEVRDQGTCGSCFAFTTFTTVATIEAQHYKKYGKNKEFSQQQIVDCD